MKKIVILFMVVVSLVMNAACSNQNTVPDDYSIEENGRNDTSTSSAEAAETSSEEPVKASNEETAEASSVKPDDSNNAESNNKKDNTERLEDNMMNVKIGENLFKAALVDNSTTKALKEMLAEGPITIDMRDYGNMEKVGEIGKKLPANDENITTEPGDLILYQGSALVIYYEPNTWSFTRIGKIDNVTKEELKAALGSGGVTVTLSLD